MERWEEWAVFSSMISVAIFIFLNIINYILILFGYPNLGIFFPIKTIIVIGIGWWLMITAITIYYERNRKKGVIWYLLSILSISALIVSIYWAFFIKRIYYINDVNELAGAGMASVFIYGSISLIIGITSLIYYTFSESRSWRYFSNRLRFFR
ncbi:MAG: hypothetical protein H5T45_05020 [Thermoplasmatales archaeon]|nr:hypothetical protein [Thermoplasmatales archaeon]